MLSKLIKGELQRLQKYNVTLIALLVALIWSAFLYFIDNASLFMSILPLLVMIDITMMSILYTGAVLNFEKSESTMPSLLVTPVSSEQLILSKIIANVIHQTISTLLVVFVFILIRDVSVNLFLLIPVMMLSVALHTLIGFFFSYTSKDFTSLLANMMVVMILLTIPSVLIYVDVWQVSGVLEYVVLLNPIEQSLHLVNSVFGKTYDAGFYISLVLMILYFFAIYQWYVKPKFITYVQKGSGV